MLANRRYVYQRTHCSSAGDGRRPQYIAMGATARAPPAQPTSWLALRPVAVSRFFKAFLYAASDVDHGVCRLIIRRCRRARQVRQVRQVRARRCDSHVRLPKAKAPERRQPHRSSPDPTCRNSGQGFLSPNEAEDRVGSRLNARRWRAWRTFEALRIPVVRTHNYCAAQPNAWRPSCSPIQPEYFRHSVGRRQRAREPPQRWLDDPRRTHRRRGDTHRGVLRAPGTGAQRPDPKPARVGHLARGPERVRPSTHPSRARALLPRGATGPGAVPEGGAYAAAAGQ
jgi:hypothetical protein